MEFLNRGLDFSVRILFRTFAFSFVVCLLAPAVFPQSLPQRLPRSVSMASGFVGGSTCRKCHPSEYESYQKMSMASSLYKPMLANDPEFAV